MVVSSAAKCSTDLDIFVSASRRTGSITTASRASSGGDERADRLAQHDALDVAGYQQVEDHDGHVVVHAECQCCVVHHFDPSIENFKVSEMLELDPIGVQLWVGGVPAVHLRPFEDHVSPDLTPAHRAGALRCQVP